MKTILVIERIPYIFDAIRIYNAGHAERDELVLAHSLSDGLLVASSLKPDIIVVDDDLPWIDGLELTDRLNADPSTHDITVFLLTDLPRLSRTAHCGLKSVLTPAGIVRRVNAFLGRK